MAKKISELTDLNATPASDDKLVILDTSASQTKRIDYNDFIGTTLLITMFQGCLQRPKFEYNNTTSILISSAWYEHNGTAQQILYWNAQLTYTFGSGGSNANSDDLGASEWHYLYIDDSELSGAEMVAGEFVNNTTAPSWSEAKHGWYNGDDKCIGAFLTDGSSQIVEFYHDGGEQLFFADGFGAITHTATSWADVDLSIYVPGFSTKADLSFYTTYDAEDTATFGYWRTNGQTGSNGHIIGIARNSGEYRYRQINTTTVMTDSSQIIECKMSDGDASLRIYTNGWFFPRGM